MDDSPQDDEEGGALLTGFVTILHIVFFACVIRWARQCCCRRDPEAAKEAGAGGNEVQATADEDQLQPKKSVCTCYLLWLIAGPFGAHHFYLDRLVHGISAGWTLNFLFCGWFLDALLIPCYVRGFNQRLAYSKAPYDGSARRLLIRVPLTLITIFGLLIGMIFYGPAMLQMSGLVDIDRIAAQTQANPYDILGVKRGAPLKESKVAYRKESLRWHPDRNHGCGKKCESKMFEITKAFELIKKRQAPIEGEKTWERMFTDCGKDWLSVLEAFSADSRQ